jgi:cyclopropane fatty-acyl-phospholipid synthase-like methyltransferase
MEASDSPAVATARTYYNSNDADNFYANIWGGENIHIGLYESDNDSIVQASHRTVQKIASLLKLHENSRVLDIGAGYGGMARYLVKHTGCQVDCLNLSQVQNQRHQQLNQLQGLTTKIRIIEGNFEAIPAAEQQYDVVLSQDAILHSGDRRQVFKEVARVLKFGGEFVFTDPMQSDHCPPNILQPVLERLNLDSMGSVNFYQQLATEVGLENIQLIEMTEQLVNHYRHILQAIEKHDTEILQVCHPDYIERMKIGLKHWIEKGQQGYLVWGILHFRKKLS